jgi:hypothetical protein
LNFNNKHFYLGSPTFKTSPTTISHFVKAINPNIKKMTSRYSISEENIILMNCKCVICDILNVIMDLRNDFCISLFLNEFKQEFNFMKTRNKENGFENSSLEHNSENAIESTARKIMKGLMRISSNALPENPQSNSLNPLEWINKIMNNDDSMRITNNDKVCDVDINILLLDLTGYKSDDLVNKSFELLYRLFSQKHKIFHTILNIQVLEDEFLLKSYHEIREIKARLEKNVENSEKWFTIESTQEQIFANKTTQEIKKLISVMNNFLFIIY